MFNVQCSMFNVVNTSMFSPFFFIFRMTSGLTGSLTSALPPWPITNRSNLRSSISFLANHLSLKLPGVKKGKERKRMLVYVFHPTYSPALANET